MIRVRAGGPGRNSERTVGGMWVANLHSGFVVEWPSTVHVHQETRVCTCAAPWCSKKSTLYLKTRRNESSLKAILSFPLLCSSRLQLIFVYLSPPPVVYELGFGDRQQTYSQVKIMQIKHTADPIHKKTDNDNESGSGILQSKSQ